MTHERCDDAALEVIANVFIGTRLGLIITAAVVGPLLVLKMVVAWLTRNDPDDDE